MDNGLSISGGHSPFKIIIRDYSRCTIFYEDNDYHKFLIQLKNSLVSYSCLLHAYALLPDHIQLLISCRSFVELEEVLLRVMNNYSNYFNYTHRRINRLLDLDHKYEKLNPQSSLVPFYRYIESMPVISSIVNHPADYPWSSYGSNALGEDVGLITAHESYMSLGQDEDTRWSTYRASFEVM